LVNRLLWFAVGGLMSLATLASPIPSAAAPRTIYPSSVEQLDPIVGSQVTESSKGEAEDGEAIVNQAREVLLRQLKKLSAASTTAPVADLLLPPGPAPTSGGPRFASSTVLNSFSGLDFDAGGSILRPDTNVAKSGTRVLEAVNSTLRLFNVSGGTLATMSTAAFVGSATSMTDPRVFYDGNSANPRLFLVVLESANVGTKSSGIWLAVSRSPNPSDLQPASWCRYRINGVYNAPDAAFADFPTLGVGADAVVLAANHYRFANGEFGAAVVRAINKTVIENNAGSCPSLTSFTFQASPTFGDTDAQTLQAVQHYTSPSSFPGTTNPVYLISTQALTVQKPGSGVWRVWRVRNVASGTPVLNVLDVTSFFYQTPLDASQPNGPLLRTLDSRVHQAGGVGNSIWAVQSTLCTWYDGSNGDCVRVMRFDVNQVSGQLTASVSYQLLFGGGPGVYYWMPSVAVSSVQKVGTAFQYSSGTSYLSSAWTALDASTNQFPGVTTILAGTCTTQAQTGDYTGATTNDDLVSFWLAGEASAPNGGGICEWKTQIVQINP